MVGYEANVEGKENEKLLVLLPNTVVDPGTVVIHLADTPLTHRAMVGSLRLNTAAFRALEYHLTLLKPHLLDIFFGCIPSGHSSWVGEHCSEVRADR